MDPYEKKPESATTEAASRAQNGNFFLIEACLHQVLGLTVLGSLNRIGAYREQNALAQPRGMLWGLIAGYLIVDGSSWIFTGACITGSLI